LPNLYLHFARQETEKSGMKITQIKQQKYQKTKKWDEYHVSSSLAWLFPGGVI
jgi:hypothetical protein